MVRLGVLLLPLLASVACQSFERVDDGQACLVAGDPVAARDEVASFVPAWTDVWMRTLEADEPLLVAVGADFGACDEDRELVCSVTVDADQVRITSARSWTASPGGCTSNIVREATTCEVPPLAAGEWQVIYGTMQHRLLIPSVLQDPCLNPSRDAFLAE